LFSPGTYLVCGAAAYTCLPPGWKGICTKALLTPQIDVVSGNQSLPIPLAAYTCSKSNPNHSLTDSHGNHGCNRYRHRGRLLVSPYLSKVVKGIF
jgi:hypothetical protein